MKISLLGLPSATTAPSYGTRVRAIFDAHLTIHEHHGDTFTELMEPTKVVITMMTPAGTILYPQMPRQARRILRLLDSDVIMGYRAMTGVNKTGN